MDTGVRVCSPYPARTREKIPPHSWFLFCGAEVVELKASPLLWPARKLLHSGHIGRWLLVFRDTQSTHMMQAGMAVVEQGEIGRVDGVHVKEAKRYRRLGLEALVLCSFVSASGSAGPEGGLGLTGASTRASPPHP